MKKSILNIGKALNKAEQKEIFGGNTELGGMLIFHPENPKPTDNCGTNGPGNGPECCSDSDCCHYQHNSSYGYVCTVGGICAPGIFESNPCG